MVLPTFVSRSDTNGTVKPDEKPKKHPKIQETNRSVKEDLFGVGCWALCSLWR